MKENTIVFDERLVNHYNDLGLVIPFQKFVEQLVYTQVQALLDRYMAAPVEGETTTQNQ